MSTIDLETEVIIEIELAYEEEWSEEIRLRVEELESGRMQTIPLNDFSSQMFKEFQWKS